MKKLLVMLMSVALGALANATTPIEVQTKVEPGKWCSDFNAAKAYADLYDVPMLVFWASRSCTVCKGLENRCAKDHFVAWQASRQLVMVFSEGDEQVKEWVRNDSLLFPYMAVYWKSNTKGAQVMEKFTGRTGYMTKYHVDESDSQEIQLMDAVDYILSDWDPTHKPTPEELGYIGGEFVVPSTTNSHLEAIAGKTTAVSVPLYRENGVAFTATNELAVGEVKYQVVWQPGENRKLVAVDVTGAEAGTDIALELLHTNAVHATGYIRVVDEPENSTDNPAWIGEKFGFGEWTMDLDAAKVQTADADGDAYTMVFFTGVQWCPWCLGLEKHVFASEEFGAWARDNQINLVLLDNSKRSANDKTSGDQLQVSTVANGSAPTLLRYDTGANGRSGAAYLSRKGITEDAAEAKLAANHQLGYLGGTYCAPEALRTGYPTVILLDKAGTECARLNYQADSSAGKDADGAYFCDKAENLQRLNDMLAQAKAGKLSEADKYWSATTLAHEFGSVGEVSLSVNHSQSVFALNGIAGHRVTFSTLTNSSGRAVTYTVLRATVASVAKVDANGVTVETVEVPSSEVVASANDTLTCDFVEAGVYYLKVATYSDARTAIYGETGTTSVVRFQTDGEVIETENKYLGTAISTIVPMSDADGVIGTLTVSSSRKNRVTVRYTSAYFSGVVTMSGYWGEPDSYGTAVMTGERGSVSVKVALKTDGTVIAELTDERLAGDILIGESSVADLDYSQYAGLYTVALPVENVSAPIVAPTGIGYVIVKANTSTARRSGKVSCSVCFPNGKSTTVTGQLIAGDAGFARLTLFVKTGSDFMTIPLQIRPNAYVAPTHRAVMVQSGCNVSWIHSDRYYSYELTCGVYGSCYNKAESLLDCCADDSLLARYDITSVLESERHGALVAVAGAGETIEVSERTLRTAKSGTGLKFSVSRSYGRINGSTKLQFADGKRISAKLTGIILPDWHDCGCFDDDPTVPLEADLPFALGSCYFKDPVDGHSVTRGFSFGFAAPEN